MSDLEKPVWVWLPGAHAPVQCGLFRLENKVGTFYYLDDYRARADALALDPRPQVKPGRRVVMPDDAAIDQPTPPATVGAGAPVR